MRIYNSFHRLVRWRSKFLHEPVEHEPGYGYVIRVRESTSQQRQAILAYYKFDRLNVGIYIFIIYIYVCVCRYLRDVWVEETRRRDANETSKRRVITTVIKKRTRRRHGRRLLFGRSSCKKKNEYIYMFLYILLYIGISAENDDTLDSVFFVFHTHTNTRARAHVRVKHELNNIETPSCPKAQDTAGAWHVRVGAKYIINNIYVRTVAVITILLGIV